jgi:hypothetical protein
MEGDRSAEQEIHARFAHLRLGRTEQFRPGNDLMRFIGMPMLVNSSPEAVGRDLKYIHLGLTPDQHHQFRIAAAIEGTSMMQLVLRLVTEYLDAQPDVSAGQKKGKKP